MPRVLRTPEARESIQALGRHIAEESGSRDVALRFLDRIDKRCQQHARAPLLGEIRDDLAPGTRCFYVGNYVVIYHPHNDGITVLLVIHSARDIPRVFRQVYRGNS